MTEDTYYTQENFNLSYTDNQKQARRVIIGLRNVLGYSIAEMAEICEIKEDKLNNMELGNTSISLLDLAMILDKTGLIRFCIQKRE